MNDCGKCQYPKKWYFLKNHKIAFLHFSRVYKNGPFKEKKNFNFFSLCDPRWTIVQNLLHFGWNFKHKPPQATDSPHPFKKRTQRARAILMWWMLFLIWCVGWLFLSISSGKTKSNVKNWIWPNFHLSYFWNLVRFYFWHLIRSPQSKHLEKFTLGRLLSS